LPSNQLNEILPCTYFDLKTSFFSFLGLGSLETLAVLLFVEEAFGAAAGAGVDVLVEFGVAVRLAVGVGVVTEADLRVTLSLASGYTLPDVLSALLGLDLPRLPIR